MWAQANSSSYSDPEWILQKFSHLSIKFQIFAQQEKRGAASEFSELQNIVWKENIECKGQKKLLHLLQPK